MDDFLEHIIASFPNPLDEKPGLVSKQPFQFGYDLPETRTQFHFHGPDDDHLTYGKLVDYDRNLLFEEKDSFALAMDDLMLSSGGFSRFPVRGDTMNILPLIGVEEEAPINLYGTQPILPVGFGRAQEVNYFGGSGIVFPTPEPEIFVPRIEPLNYAAEPIIDASLIGRPVYESPIYVSPQFDEPFRPILTPEHDSLSIDLCVAPVEHYAHTSYEPIIPVGYERAQEVGYYGGGSVLPRQDLEAMVSYQPKVEINLALDVVRDSGYSGGFKDFGSVQAYQPEPDVNFGMSFAQEPETASFGYQPEQANLGNVIESFMPTDPGISYERLPDPMPDSMLEPIMPQPWETSVPDYGACGIIDAGDFMMDSF